MLRLIGVTLLSALAGMTANAQDNMGTPIACPAGTYLVPGTTQCTARCPSPLLGYKGACVQMCPTGLLIEPMSATCVSTCPAGSVPTSSGVCTQEQMCPPDKIPYNGMCVSMDYMCQIKVPGSVFNGQECVCPAGAWMTRRPSVNVSMTVESYCTSWPAMNSTSATGGTPPPPVNCESYIANTVYNWQYQECQCSPRFPVIVRNPVDPALPFGCAPPGTATDIRPCLLPMYFSFPEGQCVNVTMQSPAPAPTPSASASPSPSVSVRPSLPPPSPSASPSAKGGQEPSMSAKPTERAAQEPSASETMTAKPTQRSDGGGSSDADTSSTPRPAESMKPSERPADSMKPSERPAESMKPSERPVESTQKPTPSAFPTRRPDAMWAVDVTRKPLPSRPPMPSFSQRPLLQSAKPTPWRPRDPLPSGMPRPPYIQSSVKFPAANATKMQRPDVIQELQASLACTLNLPLDNIRIQNIMIRRDGVAPLVIDVSTFPQLRSNGTSGCFRPAAPVVAATRRLRALQQQQSSSSVDVDYYIVEPTDDVLALSTAEFSTILSNSAPMTEIAASVGSSGVSAVATEPNTAGPAPSPAATATTNASGIQLGSLVGGVVGGIALCVAAFTAYKLATRGRRSGAAPLQSTAVTQSRVILVDNTNPLQIHASNNSMRLVGYAPTQTRASV